jgi:Tfp pilus assembly protein PilN
VAPRRPIDRAIERLAEIGLTPEVVDLALDEEDAEALGPPTHDLGGAVRRPRLPKAIPIGAALILFTAFASGVFAFFDLQSRQAALEQRQGYAAMLADRLQDLPDLRARIEMLEDEDRAALDRHLAHPSALVTIETLSQVLPDSVWLESLTLSEGHLLLNGYSTDAAKLPSLLEGTAAFRAAAFTASNERLMMPRSDDEVIEVDRFTLQADVRPDAGLLP